MYTNVNLVIRVCLVLVHDFIWHSASLGSKGKRGKTLTSMNGRK